MNAKIISIILWVSIIAGGGAFYSGVKYDQNKNTAAALAKSASRAQFGGGGAGLFNPTNHPSKMIQ